jgi:hypothetical protein
VVWFCSWNAMCTQHDYLVNFLEYVVLVGVFLS